MATYSEARKLVTGEVRLSYANVWEPQATKNDDGSEGKPKYSATLLIPKSDTRTLALIHAAQHAAIEDLLGVGKGGKDGKLPPGWKNTLRDGDEEKDLEESPEYAGMMFMSTSANDNRPPGIVNAQAQPILDQSEVYSGCYIKAQIRSYTYDIKGKGVSFGLLNLQKVRDGEPLGGVVEKAEDVFKPLADEDLI